MINELNFDDTGGIKLFPSWNNSKTVLLFDGSNYLDLVLESLIIFYKIINGLIILTRVNLNEHNTHEHVTEAVEWVKRERGRKFTEKGRDEQKKNESGVGWEKKEGAGLITRSLKHKRQYHSGWDGLVVVVKVQHYVSQSLCTHRQRYVHSIQTSHIGSDWNCKSKIAYYYLVAEELHCFRPIITCIESLNRCMSIQCNHRVCKTGACLYQRQGTSLEKIWHVS